MRKIWARFQVSVVFFLGSDLGDEVYLTVRFVLLSSCGVCFP